MRRFPLSLGLLVVTALVGSGCGPEPESDDQLTDIRASALTGGTALLVVGNTTLGGGDVVAQARLQAHGLVVVVRKDSAVTGADVAGKNLIVVSSTVTSSSVAVNLRAVAIPLLTWESALLDDYGFVGPAAGTLGTQANQTQVAMVAPASDPMAAGLSGNQTVVSAAQPFSWGKPGPGANIVARLTGDASKAVIFRYEKGRSMVGLVAPERRAALFLGDATGALLTTGGRALVDAAMEWVGRLGKPRGTPCASDAECGSGFCAGGVCCASACTSACTSCNLPGQAGTCAPVPAGTTCQPAMCTGGSTLAQARTCDGSGTCRAASVVSCAPFVCSGSRCAVTCLSNADCVAPNRCFAGVCGRGPNGAACAVATDCASGFCTDGICCSSICAGPCVTCGLAGAAGTCRPVPAGQPDPRNSCPVDSPATCGHDGQCDGGGGCRRYGQGTICAAATCSGSTRTGAATCDGQGVCLSGTSTSCLPYTCTVNGSCRLSCASDADCGAGFLCRSGLCG